MSDNKSFERAEEFRYLGINLTNHNSIQEEVNSGLNWACLISFGAESFVFQFSIQKFED
jgi:hypothetical protein